MKAFGILALRIFLAIIFVYSGYAKLFPNHDMAVAGFGAMGFPMPSFWVWLVGLVELIGGLMIGLGVYARYAAVPLSITMLVAIFVAHWGSPIKDYFLPFAVLGGCLSLMGTGAGCYRLVKTECHCTACKGMEGGKEGGCCGGKGACGCGDNEMKK
jgi:putative oxidoreductase